MLSVAAVSTGDAGVALHRGAGRASGRLVIEHWSNLIWKQVAVPGEAVAAFDHGGTTFAIIGASAERNVWAFNQMTGARLRWNGRRWSEGLIGKLTARSAIGISRHWC
jgi:hypothetical protein